MTKYILFFGLCYGLFACGKKLSNNFAQQPPANTVNIPMVETASSLSSVFSFDQYILLDSSVSIGSISKVLIQGDRVMVGDYKNTKDVYCFDATGHLIWQAFLNKLSPGYPINDFLLDPNSGDLLVSKGEFIYVFDQHGRLTAEKVLKIGQHEYIHKIARLEEDLFCVQYKAGDLHKPYLLGLFDSDFEPISPALTRPFWAAHSIRSISNLNQAICSSSALFSEYFNDTIYRIEASGLGPEYVLDKHQSITANNSISDKDFDQISAMAKTSGLAIGPDLVYETEHTLHVSMLQNGVYSSTYFDKKSRKTQLINRESDDLFGGSFGHIPYAVLPNDRYVFVVEPFLLHKIPQGALTQYHPLLKAMHSKTTWSSNPILLIGTLKTENDLPL